MAFRSCLLVSRRTSSGARAAVCTEAAAMLPTVRLRGRAAVGPQVEGGEAGGSARDGRVRDVTTRRRHRGDIPGGG